MEAPSSASGEAQPVEAPSSASNRDSGKPSEKTPSSPSAEAQSRSSIEASIEASMRDFRSKITDEGLTRDIKENNSIKQKIGTANAYLIRLIITPEDIQTIIKSYKQTIIDSYSLEGLRIGNNDDDETSLSKYIDYELLSGIITIKKIFFNIFTIKKRFNEEDLSLFTIESLDLHRADMDYKTSLVVVKDFIENKLGALKEFIQDNFENFDIKYTNIERFESEIIKHNNVTNRVISQFYVSILFKAFVYTYIKINLKDIDDTKDEKE